MINLAGNDKCDPIILAELKEAGIDPISPVYPVRGKGFLGEVPTNIAGWLGGSVKNKKSFDIALSCGMIYESTLCKIFSFVFVRAWYYWTVDGFVPIETAEKIYATKEGKKNVRAGGHCGCVSPETQLFPARIAGKRCVNGYHIDTQEGLNFFVETLKRDGLV